jgi:uncharacterized membrane protein YccC
MRSGLFQEIADSLKFAINGAVHAGKTLAAAYASIGSRDQAARAATATTLAVVLAVFIGCAIHLQEVWWAAISAFMTTNPQSTARGMQRILGTAVGAMLAIMLVGWLSDDLVSCCLVLFVVVVVGSIGFNVSPSGYAWLFVCITFGMVLLSSLPNPVTAFSFGIDRIIEVVIGTGAAMAVANLLIEKAPIDAPVLDWSDLLSRGLPIVMHAIRSGVAVALLPVVWSTFDLPGASQMAVTLVAVLATPVMTDLHATHRRVVERGVHRLFGCLLGGLLALALLGLNFSIVLSWLSALAGGVWLFAYLQHGTHDATYVGTQAGVVFIITLVQGSGPPESILPGIDRFAGVSLGLLILFLAIFLIGSPAAASGLAPTVGPRRDGDGERTRREG